MVVGLFLDFAAELEDIVVFEAVYRSLFAFAWRIRHHHFEIEITYGDSFLFACVSLVLDFCVVVSFADQGLFFDEFAPGDVSVAAWTLVEIVVGFTRVIVRTKLKRIGGF